jgi:hypothetical protein
MQHDFERIIWRSLDSSIKYIFGINNFIHL